jgi:hypothetical protein
VKRFAARQSRDDRHLKSLARVDRLKANQVRDAASPLTSAFDSHSTNTLSGRAENSGI